MQTSRLWLIDAIEFIANQIALFSHYQELINELMLDYDTETDIVIKEQLTAKIGEYEMIRDRANALRRTAMEGIRDGFDNSDQKLRCAVKHAIGSRMYASEVSAGNNSILRQDLQIQAYRQMIQILSQFLGMDEIQVCGRCLQDILLSKK